MRVLHVFKDYFPPTYGGIEQHVHDLVHSIDGVSCCVLTSARSHRRMNNDDDGIPVLRTAEYGRPFSTPITPGWLRLLRRLRPDLIHLHMPSPFGELAVLACGTRVPIVASYHADIVRCPRLAQVYRPLQQALLRRAASIVVSSPRMAATSATLDRHRHRVVTIPYGVDAAKWRRRPPAADEIRRRHPGPLVLFLGRLVRYKRIDLLIDAMPALQATLLVVGDGPERERLEHLARRRRLQPRVAFVGAVPSEERAAYYHAADVFVLPSPTRAESFGIAMLEAMASGTPAVCVEVGTGSSWLNRHGETGVVLGSADSARLAGAVRGLLQDDAMRRAMGRSAAERVREHFPKTAMLESIAAEYRRVYAQRRATARR